MFYKPWKDCRQAEIQNIRISSVNGEELEITLKFKGVLDMCYIS